MQMDKGCSGAGTKQPKPLYRGAGGWMSLIDFDCLLWEDGERQPGLRKRLGTQLALRAAA